MKFANGIEERGLACARGVADWLCAVQYPHQQSRADAGSFPWVIDGNGNGYPANNWNLAFAVMGLLSAYKAFGEKRYETAALRMGNYLKSLQIFDPFKPEHHGAIREMTPQTPWCYTRDALSAAWGFVELHRHTGDAEWLERARLWAEWFLGKGMDADGWPLWGVQFEPWFAGCEPQMRNDVQGSFQGGGLNFFHQLAKETGDARWSGPFFVNIADYFVSHVQQPSGYFASIERSSRKPPEADPQGGLHRANDDLGTLGLLCAHHRTEDARQLGAVRKFLAAVFAAQREDGNFEESVACVPVILNVCLELERLTGVSAAPAGRLEKALEALYARQSDGGVVPSARGGIVEIEGQPEVCARSSCYALIVLLKAFAGVEGYLTV